MTHHNRPTLPDLKGMTTRQTPRRPNPRSALCTKERCNYQSKRTVEIARHLREYCRSDEAPALLDLLAAAAAFTPIKRALWPDNHEGFVPNVKREDK